MVDIVTLVNDSLKLYQGLKRAEEETEGKDPILDPNSSQRDEVLRNFAKQLFAKIDVTNNQTDSFFHASKTKVVSFYDLVKKFLRLFTDLRHSIETKLIEEAKEFYDQHLLQALEGDFIDTLQFHEITNSDKDPIYRFYPKTFQGHEFFVSVKPYQAKYDAIKILQITDANNLLAFKLECHSNGRGNNSSIGFSDLHGRSGISDSTKLETLSCAAQKKVFSLIEKIKVTK